MNLLVTGAAGFIGSNCCAALARTGHSVCGVDCFSDYYDPALKRRNAASLASSGVTVAQADLAADPIDALLEDIDGVLHFAAQPGISATTPWESYFRNNILATHRLVEASRSAGVGRFAPLPVRDPTAHRRIDFRQADVREMPFADAAFDLVFTRLAVEQMEHIRDAALAEIHRVTKGYALFVEPFADFNRAPLQALATRSKNYLSLRVDELPRHGFEPVFTFSDWPHKITNAAGLVLCRKIARPA